ncbi:HAD family hydrolase [Puia dinghuensis]|uniref:Beta-phosphoglucomutase n=1 Tax=Puia dinghuensis TaxID=1792502 RepID=A0A8J2XT04_9BACT|nr:HAD family phosphatase [Puia dinghuensis]GGA99455.1 beta-phosphoglucomutase [Puia dinghuensis]
MNHAFIFDLNGTMINDMEYHSIAWHSILNNDLKAGLTMAEVKSQMYGKNEELLDRVFGKGHFTKEEVDTISMKKENSYQAAFKPHLRLIAGLPAFLEKAGNKGIRMAIGSAAIPFNIDFVLDNLGIRHHFKAIVSADEVAVSKPDPETFLLAARLLGVSPESCIVFEDAPKGVEAAMRAGMSCIVLTTMHEKEEFRRYPNVLQYIADYTDRSLDKLFI